MIVEQVGHDGETGFEHGVGQQYIDKAFGVNALGGVEGQGKLVKRGALERPNVVGKQSPQNLRLLHRLDVRPPPF